MARSRWTKSGKPGKYGMEFDISDNVYSSPDSEEWFKKFLRGAKTVGVNENGPAGGNPMFVLTADNPEALSEAMQAYYTGKNGEDLFEDYEGRNREDGWNDTFNNYLFETSSKGPDYWKQFGEDFADEPHDKGIRTSGVLAGDVTPEEAEMLKLIGGKRSNSINRLAKELSKHRF